MQELTYDLAFPGRFLKADLLDGRHVTVGIAKVYQEVLEGEKGEETKLIIAFMGAKREIVCNKTNALCLKEMFGSKCAEWIGKRITMFPTKVNFGPKKVDAIRIAGSPDIEADIEVSARIGRKQFKTTLRKTPPKAQATANLDAEDGGAA